MYCHQDFVGGKYDLIQLHRQIIHQNDWIFMKHSLKPFPPAFSIQNLKKTMKMTWLHMEFVLIFITGPSRAKSGRTARQKLLTLASLAPRIMPSVPKSSVRFYPLLFPLCTNTLQCTVCGYDSRITFFEHMLYGRSYWAALK